MSFARERVPVSGGASTKRLMLTVMSVLICTVLAVLIFLRMNPQPDTTLLMASTGLNNPVTNQLDPRFKDANQDLVADPPSDRTRWVDPPVLVFTYIATPDDERYAEVFVSLMRHLEAETGREVVYRGFEDAQRQLSAIKKGEVHIAGLSTGQVPVAVNATGFVPVAMLGSDVGNVGYRMQLIVRADSPLQTVRGIIGKSLALTSPTSNSGYKAPLVILKEDFGLQLERDYNLVYSYGHEQSIRGIVQGQYAVAAIASDMIERTEGIDPDQIRVIYESERFPTAAFGYIHRLVPSLAAKVRQALVGYSFEGTTLEPEFDQSPYHRLIPVDYKTDWSIIRRIDNALGVRHVVE